MVGLGSGRGAGVCPVLMAGHPTSRLRRRCFEASSPRATARVRTKQVVHKELIEQMLPGRFLQIPGPAQVLHIPDPALHLLALLRAREEAEAAPGGPS